ncbi:NitT/TauT family transport system ATP-binding protein [Tistlia consotensis]|uniref:NitT/TauT family transport system ATP-binding protein n=1 Tax=Tistlia consotensis USBA 355 TaxID=560819 RepID=A0A1Y6C0V4_9PROT|nr:ATP-binding cassette domain-containing protein [Tistlia consotensis]SMF36140.1 NitT/TauT family transport system ATP-binding protein [Tistlia consotensis USBA 355]SNR71503.1 NitT/TauT family transport system ATP-binding protein [Tistlia consotensis]
MTEIVVKDLFKDYDRVPVLERVNLTLTDHEFCVVLGPSGAGKTTFLRLLLSQETPTRGSIEIDGRPIAPEPEADRGVVFQRYSVFPHKTVLHNVMIGPELTRSRFLGRLFGKARRELEEKARGLLGQVGLADAVDKYPVQLSGGMQQRLAIAQALIMEPKVLLLDEPFGALDQSTKKSMHGLILDLWRANRMIIIMVTHDIQEAFTLGTRVLMIDKVRHDPQAPEAYGSTITQHLRLDPQRKPSLGLAGAEESRTMQDIFRSWADRMGPAVVADPADEPPRQPELLCHAGE